MDVVTKHIIHVLKISPGGKNTLKEIYKNVKILRPKTTDESIRGRIYEHTSDSTYEIIKKDLFYKVAEGVWGLREFRVGEFKNIKIGTKFPDRSALRKSGLHKPLVHGIDMDSGDFAVSIVLSGSYEDDEDFDNLIHYTGQGGRETHEKGFRTSKQVKDQSFDISQNKSLIKAEELGTPVRVIRGHKLNSDYRPEKGYRYDGLYYVTGHWYQRGEKGFKICRFKLERSKPKQINKENKAVTLDNIHIGSVIGDEGVKLSKDWKTPVTGDANEASLAREKANKDHQIAVNQIINIYKSMGYKNHEMFQHPHDLLIKNNKIIHLYEVKTVPKNKSSFKNQLRKGLAQLLEYRYNLKFDNNKETKTFLTLNKKPMHKIESKFQGLFESLDLTINWIDDNSIKK